MKRSADATKREVHFNVGDSVYLRLQPYREQSLAKFPHEKLGTHFYAPFTILQKIGPAAHKLQLPAASNVHPVFHVSQLKPAVGPIPVLSNIPEHVS